MPECVPAPPSHMVLAASVSRIFTWIHLLTLDEDCLPSIAVPRSTLHCIAVGVRGNASSCDRR